MLIFVFSGLQTSPHFRGSRHAAGNVGGQASLGLASTQAWRPGTAKPEPLIGQPFHERNIAATPWTGDPSHRVVVAEMTTWNS